jgi:hypothetical protein
MGIEQFVTFDKLDIVKPKKKPSPKSTLTPKQKILAQRVESTKAEAKPKPKPKPQKVIEGTEAKICASAFEIDETVNTFKRYFESLDRIGKDAYNVVYKNVKTILGNPIKSTDKVLSVLSIIPGTITSESFISVSPRFVVEREMKLVAKKYVSVNGTRRVPVVVEAKYMNSEHYPKHRKNILAEYS